MNQTVDTRTVEMRFDNKNFESNVKQSMSTLDKLKKSLKLDGASKGLKEVERSSKKLEFKDLNNSIENVGNKFSALRTIATGVFLKIGMDAAEAGKKLVKSLSIDQVVSGWSKYADKTTAVQTIMANLRDESGRFTNDLSKMDYVTGQLEKLMWFSDETSYNFVDMTGNIGKFVANGQSLEDSVVAMQGIANWAAIAGQNAGTASRAMYNIAQAMGIGAMTTMDWKSIELANMATAQFKELAITVATKQGKIKEGQVTIDNFRETLQKKWFDKGVMMEVFKTYGEAADRIREYAESHNISATEAIREIKKTDKMFADSLGFKAFAAAQEAKTFKEVIDATADAVSTKWTKFFESIFGNYMEAKKLWTNLSEDLWDIFAAPLDDLNAIMDIWKRGFSEKTGDGAITTLATRIEKGAKYFSGIVKSADEVISGRDLLISGFKNLIDIFFHDVEDEDGNKILSVLGAIKAAFKDIFFPGDEFSIGKKLWDLTKKFKNFTERLKPTQETIEKLRNSFRGFFTLFRIIKKTISAIITPFKELFQNIFGKGSAGVLNLADSMGTWIQNFDTFLEKNRVFDRISNGIRSGIDKIREGLDWLSKTITGMSLRDFLSDLKDKISNLFSNKGSKKTGGFTEKVSKIVTTFKNIITDIKQVRTGDLPDKLTPLQNFIIGLSEIFRGLKALINAISIIFRKVATLMANIFEKIADILSGKSSGSSRAITKTAEKSSPYFDALKSILGGIIDFFRKVGPAFKKIGEFLGKVFSAIGDRISKFAETHGALDIIRFIINNVLKIGLVKKIGELLKAFEQLVTSGSGILNNIKTFFGNLSGVVGDFRERLRKKSVVKDVKNIAIVVTLFSASLLILAGAFATMANIKFDNASIWEIGAMFAGFLLIAGGIAIAAGKLLKTTEKGDPSKALWKVGNFIRKLATVLTIVAGAFAIMAAVKFDNASIWEIGAMFGAFLLIASGIAVAAGKLLKDKDSLKSVAFMAGFMVAAAVSLIPLAKAFKMIGEVPPDTIVSAGIVFGLFMAATAGMAFLAKKIVKDSSAIRSISFIAGFMVTAAVSLIPLAFAFKTIGGVSPDTLWQAGIVFAGFMAAAAGMAALAKVIVKDAKSIMGIAVMAGFMVVTAGALIIVAKAFSELTNTISPQQMIAALAIMVTFSLIVAGLAAIGTALASTGYGLAGMALIAVIIAAIGLACLAAGVGIASMVDSVSNLIDAFMRLMDAADTYGTGLVDKLALIFDAILVNIINSAPKIKDAAVAVIKAIADAVIETAPIISYALTMVLLYLMDNVNQTMNQSIPILIKTFTDLIPVLINSIANDLRRQAPIIAKAVQNLMEAVIETVLLGIAAIVEPWGAVGKGIAKKIGEWIPSIRKSFEIIDEEGDSVINGVIETNKDLETSLSSTGDILSAFKTGVQGLFNFDGEGGILSGLLGNMSEDDFLGLLGGLSSKTEDEMSNITSAVKKETPQLQEALKNAYELGMLDNLEGQYNYVTAAAAEQAVATDSAKYSIKTLEDGTKQLITRIDDAPGHYKLYAKTIYDENDKIEESTNGLVDMFKSASDSTNTSGFDMISNFADGMEDGFPKVQQKANKILGYLHDRFAFSEPKKGPLSDFHTYAPDMIDLWCKGIRDNFGKIDNSSNIVTQRIKDSFATALDYVISLIDGGMSDDLTIRPILDLSEIQNGTKELDSIINSRNGYSLRGTADLASSAAYNMRSITKPVQQTIEQPVSAGNNTYNNTFYITNSDPNAVAEKVSRIIQQQVVRKQAVWAK